MPSTVRIRDALTEFLFLCRAEIVEINIVQ
jgi:hypothetical protein